MTPHSRSSLTRTVLNLLAVLVLASVRSSHADDAPVASATLETEPTATISAGGDVVRPHELEGLMLLEHDSPALGRRAQALVWLPEGVAAVDAAAGVAGDLTRYPVLYVMHGAYGSMVDWPERTNVREIARAYEMILVFPDGGEFGWYVDSPIDPASQYASYITRDLLDAVERNFPVVREKAGRGIMGLSMGGHGALILAARNPQLYASASALSGILRLTNHPDKWQIAQRLGPIDEAGTQWLANSVVDQAERFRSANVRLMFDCGVNDTTTGAIEDNRQMHARLLELQVPHIYREFDGAHTWEYWQRHLPQHLNFHQATLQPTGPEMARWKAHYFQRLDAFLTQNARLRIEGRPALPRVVLLGSSSLEMFPADLLPGIEIINRGIASDNLGLGSRGIAHRMEECIFDVEPDVVVIKTGRNDLGDRHRSSDGRPTLDEMATGYESIVAAIRQRLPQTRIIIINSFPVRGRFSHLAAAILEWNPMLEAVAQRHGAEFIDAHSLLVDDDGLMKEAYTNDGLHLTRPAYEILAHELTPLVAIGRRVSSFRGQVGNVIHPPALR